MTERTDSAIATAEAILKLLEDTAGKIPDASYESAIHDVRTFAASLRLHQPPKRGRRPNASKGGE